MMIQPIPGRKVRHPSTKRHIPETPIEVPDGDPYWTRRLADGDVIEAAPAAAPLASPPSKKGKE